MSVPSQENHVEYHVLKHGEMFGPFVEKDLRAGVADGRFEMHDFVQIEGQVVWQPLGRILAATEEEVKGAVAPDWSCILKWAYVRLRYSLTEQAVVTGAVCLGLGVLSLGLSRWPIFFWLPWFLAAALAGLVLFRRGREGFGALVLAAVIGLPWLFHHYEPKTHLAKAEHVAPATLVESSPAPSIPVVAAVKPAPVPAPPPVFAERTSTIFPVDPAPVIAPATSTPAPFSPAAPAPAVAKGPTAVPVAPNSLSDSLIEKAGKVADAVVPILEGAKSSIASLPSLSSLPSMFSTPATTTPPAAPPSTGDLIQSHHDAFLIMKGSNGSGSGFACRVGDKTWLFSNIHVVAEIKQLAITQLDGVSVLPGAAEVAAGPDIARFALPNPPEHPLEAMTDFDANVHIDDEVVVLGNSGGGGVVTSLKGKVVGIGPDRLEVSAEFIPGNSGSPIIHVKSGKVIGIATYLTRRHEEFGANAKNGGSVVVRRFGYRIDKVPAWEPVNWPELYAEADRLEQISKLTEDIFDFLGALHEHKDPSFATDTLRRPAAEWQTKVQNSHMSDTDRLSATQSFLNALRFMVRGDVAAVDGRLRYTYFRNRLASELKVRDRLYKAFDSDLASLSTPLSRHSYK